MFRTGLEVCQRVFDSNRSRVGPRLAPSGRPNLRIRVSKVPNSPPEASNRGFRERSRNRAARREAINCKLQKFRLAKIAIAVIMLGPAEFGRCSLTSEQWINSRENAAAARPSAIWVLGPNGRFPQGDWLRNGSPFGGPARAFSHADVSA